MLRRLPTWAAVLALAWAVLGTGCGPGVGGTGTGGSLPPLSDFGASASAVCSSNLATLLDCAATGAHADVGTAPVLLVDSAGAARVFMRVDGNTVELDAPCTPLRFVGTWGQVGSGPARFFGTATLASGPVAATLDSTPAPNGVQALLRDTGDRVLLGPVLLRPVAAAAPAACNQ